MMERTVKFIIFAATLMVFASCGQHEMVDDSRIKPYEADPFFADESSARPLVQGTIPRGYLKDNSVFYTGQEGDQFVKYSPIPVTGELLERGQTRFNIYCSVCHSQTGDGNGMVVQRGFPPPPTFHSDRLRQAPIGFFFRVMSEGSRKMPSYSDVLDEKDRWAVAAYIRVLQRSRHAQLADAPEEVQKKLESIDEFDEDNMDAPVYESGNNPAPEQHSVK